jgi:hypothetical protein
MAKIKPLPDTTARRIYRRYVFSHDREERAYLGASVIGSECSRQVWYAFRWAHPPEEFDPRILRLLDTGHREEARIIDDLREGGIYVFGQRAEFVALGGHFCGHIDGIASGIPEAPKSPHVLEIKTHNDKSFKNLLINGVKKSKPEHYAQMQIYMHYIKHDRGLYVAVNKNDDTIYTELIEYRKKEAEQLELKAKITIAAHHPPPKLHENPDLPAAYVCGWCPAKGVCHDRQPARRNCRTCLSSSPVFDGASGEWYCNYHDKSLTLEEQRAGCSAHRFLPGLVAGEQIDADPDKRTVTYKMHDSGKEWIDGVRS